MKNVFLALFVFYSLIGFTQPANNDCVNAQFLDFSNGIDFTASFDWENATSSSVSSCYENNINYNDVWFEFVVPNDIVVYIKANGQYAGMKYTVYESCGGEELKCLGYHPSINGNVTISTGGLVPGTTYKLKISKKANVGWISNPILNINFYPKATNDECDNAEILNFDENFVATSIFERHTATQSITLECEEQILEEISDLWYQFVAPFDGVYYYYDNHGYYGPNISFHENNCNQQEIFSFCDYLENPPVYLNGGTTYYLRIGYPAEEYLPFSADESFDFTITGHPTSLIGNDCQSPKLIENIEIISTQVHQTVGLTQSIDVINECSTLNDFEKDIWYEFTMPFNGDLDIYPGLSHDEFTLFNTCNDLSGRCFDVRYNPYLSNFTDLIAGNNYLIRVEYESTRTGYDGFSIKANQKVINDDCENLETIPLNGTDITTIVFDRAGSTGNENDNTCNDTPYNYYQVVNSWFQFTLPTNANSIRFRPLAPHIGNSTANTFFTLYYDCTTSEIECSNGDYNVFYNLTANNTYIVKVTGIRANYIQVDLDLTQIEVQPSFLLNTDEFTIEQAKVFPNPTTGMISIQSNYQIKELKLYNSLGKTILTNKNSSTLDVTAIESGMYFLNITTERGEIMKQIIKE